MSGPEWRKMVKARKDYTCLICKKAIKKGTKYLQLSTISGFGFVNQKMHEDCEPKFYDYLHNLNEWVEISDNTTLAGEERCIDIDRVYKDDDGEIKIME